MPFLEFRFWKSAPRDAPDKTNWIDVTDKANDIAELLSPTVSALGLELLGIEYLPAPGGAVVRLCRDGTVRINGLVINEKGEIEP